MNLNNIKNDPDLCEYQKKFLAKVEGLTLLRRGGLNEGQIMNKTGLTRREVRTLKGYVKKRSDTATVRV